MFGNKQAKKQRLNDIADTIERNPRISQSRLARRMGIPRSTLHRDLPALEALGILLSEDERGRLSLFRRHRRR